MLLANRWSEPLLSPLPLTESLIHTQKKDLNSVWMVTEDLYRMDCYFSVELISSITCISISMSNNKKAEATRMEADATRPQMNEAFIFL